MGPEGIPPGVISNITGVVDSIYALEKRVKADIKEVADKQEAFRDEVAALKERQNKLLLYFAIAAVFAGALVGVVTKMVADRLFPSSVAGKSVARGADRAVPGTSAAERWGCDWLRINLERPSHDGASHELWWGSPEARRAPGSDADRAGNP